MDLENSVKGVIEQKLSDGTIEKIIAEKFEKGINEAMQDLFRSYGDVGKVIRDKVEAVLIPSIESHDFSAHVVKLDAILTDIINSTALVENKQLLENFRELMVEDDKKKVIKVSELFEKWCDYVAGNVETCGLDVNFDDGPHYDGVEVTMAVEHDEGRGWSDFEKASIVFECEHDENMNVIIPISRWKKYDGDNWTIAYKAEPTIETLKYLSDFEVFVLKLKRMFSKIELDEEMMDESVAVDAEPEASFS